MLQPPDAKPRSTTLTVLIPFGIVTLIWGSTWLVIRDQLGVVPPSWSVSYRFLVGGICMAGWALWQRESWRLGGRGYGFAVLLGLLQFCGNFNFVYRAEQHVTSGLVSVVFAMLLIPNALFGRVFLGQKLGRQLMIGSAIAMAGVILLFVREARVDPHGLGQVLAGIGFTLCAILCASTANIMQATPTAARYPMGTTVAVAMLAGATIDAIFAYVTTGAPVVEHRTLYWLGILYLGVFASALAFPLYFGVIRTIGPAKAAYSGVIVPVIAMMLSTLFEGYRWSGLAIGGAALAAFGLVIALRARRPNR